MKVVITSTVALNGGDAAILLSIVDLLRGIDPGVEITVFDSQPRVAKRYYPELRFRKLLWRRGKRSLAPRLARARLAAAASALAAGRRLRARVLAPFSYRDLQAYQDADVVISTGGTYLVEAYDLDQRFYDFEIAERLGTPLVLFTQSLGPFEDPENRARIRRFLGDAALVLLRDERSRRHLAEVGVEDNLEVCADVVFASAPEDVAERAARRRLPEERPLRVAVSVRRWPHFRTRDMAQGMEAYRDAIAVAVTRLVEERGAEVVFLSTCQGVPEYRMNDARVAREIFDALPSTVRDRVRVDDAFHAPDDLVNRIADFDFVVSTRMHMAILSLIAGTPVVPIAYEFKTKELFRRLEGAEPVLDIETIDGDALVGAIDDFLQEIDDRREPLFGAVARERARALDAADHFVAALAGATG